MMRMRSSHMPTLIKMEMMQRRSTLRLAAGNQKICEDFEITNHFQGEVNFNFAIEVKSDFADIFEVKRHQIRPR